MRRTLRRSCDACARSKLSCDLRTPRCSRCIKRSTTCVYANEPLTLSTNGENALVNSSDFSSTQDTSLQPLISSSATLAGLGNQSFDPFDSYPQTRLPRARVQQLIQHFLSNIAFQYYPLDLNTSSNPFVVSWWPLALAEPALFHVSLQTASLDVELKARNGFGSSECLMEDSVSLVRQRIEDPILAFQDETMNSVVTLAAIEFGKGNTTVGTMHINGVKKMIQIRGGIHRVKLTSPLTARMVSWISMIVMQSPQFDTQDDFQSGEGIPPIPQWLEIESTARELLPQYLSNLELEPGIDEVFFRLRTLFIISQPCQLPSTDFHDLACYVLHRLLARSPQPTAPDHLSPLPISQCVRYAVALYMLVLHGPTYFSHAHLQSNLALLLKTHLESILDSLPLSYPPLALWLISVGMAASDGTPTHTWFISQAKTLAEYLQLYDWCDVSPLLEGVLWYKTQRAERPFQRKWEEILAMLPR